MIKFARRYFALAAFLANSGCATTPPPSEPNWNALDDVTLWQSSLVDGALNEAQCKGMSAAKAKLWYKKRFSVREQRVAKAMHARYGELTGQNIPPLGQECSFYQGATELHDQKLDMLETRLGLRKNNARP